MLTMETACQTTNQPLIPDQESPSTIFIGRQPIFDREMNIFAYELLYRDSRHNCAQVACEIESTTTVILNLITEFGFNKATGNKTAFINLSKAFLTGEKKVHLPAQKVVLEILEDTTVDQALLDGLQQLKSQGFSLALDDFVYSCEWDPVLPLVDFIKVEIPILSRDEIRQHVSQLKKLNVKLLAEKIESEEEYEFLHDCGFDLFQGYFLAKPKVIEGKTISANKLTIMSLLADLNNENVEIENLVDSISSDVSLCYKVLRYINSAHFALSRKVDSIREAITFVGLKKLKQWATLVSMSNISSQPDDLMQLTMSRAYMCEQIAMQLHKDDPQHFFSVGLFSTLDILLNLPMKKVLDNLPLSDEILDALLYFKGDTGKVLKCVIAYEQADWEKISSLELAISPSSLRDCFFAAIQNTNNSILNNS